MVTDSIDAIAPVGHVVSEISSIRREQLRPSLKREFQTICSNNVSSSSKLLFGDDLAKQIRDAKETSRIGQTVGAYTKHDGPRNRRRQNPYQSGRHDKATKVAHGSLFWREDTAQLGGKKPYTGHKNETEKQ